MERSEESSINAIWENKGFIITWTLIIVFLTLIVSLLWPKTYESESVVQVGSFGFIEMPSGKVIDYVYSPAEARILFESSVVILPVLNKYFNNKTKSLEDFKKKNLEVEIIKEKIDFGVTEVIPYIKVKTKASKAEKAKEMNENTLSGFLVYAQQDYNKRLNSTLARLDEKNKNIEKMRAEITDIEKEIKSLPNTQLSEESLSILSVLRSIVSDYDRSIIQEEFEKNKLQDKIDLKKEFKVISEPQIPLKLSSPKILLNIAIALVIGLLINVLLALHRSKM